MKAFTDFVFFSKKNWCFFDGFAQVSIHFTRRISWTSPRGPFPSLFLFKNIFFWRFESHFHFVLKIGVFVTTRIIKKSINKDKKKHGYHFHVLFSNYIFFIWKRQGLVSWLFGDTTPQMERPFCNLFFLVYFHIYIFIFFNLIFFCKKLWFSFFSLLHF